MKRLLAAVLLMLAGYTLGWQGRGSHDSATHDRINFTTIREHNDAYDRLQHAATVLADGGIIYGDVGALVVSAFNDLEALRCDARTTVD